ncbi:phosphotriesterase-related protein [Mycobacterium leprae]|uniref:phosphotriesterase-related protein n=1 Tax=Mycobacterium leprae TaxID=1769 RepID=UPI0002D63C64|nr:phosphotriesterase-related protein [Mycobacterium leprae]
MILLGRYIPRIARGAASTEFNIVVMAGMYIIITTYRSISTSSVRDAPLDGPEIMTSIVRSVTSS